MDVLVYLANRQGDVCSRDEIISAVWNVEFGADESLTRAISVIRKTFKQAGGQSTFIQTISKRGYSLQEPVSEDEISPPIMASTTTPIDAQESTNFASEPTQKTEVPDTVFAKPQKQAARSPARIFAITLLPLALLATAVVMFRPEPFGTELPASEYGRSVAVMPFVDLSTGVKHQFFSEGLAEEVSNELGRIDSLRVVGQRLGSTADYTAMSYEEIGDKLRVSYIIHGSVRKQDNLVRITAQLINTEDNSHTWSSTYDGSLKDVFELQNRVANDIMTELSLLFSVTFFQDPIELEGISPTVLGPEIK